VGAESSVTLAADQREFLAAFDQGVNEPSQGLVRRRRVPTGVGGLTASGLDDSLPLRPRPRWRRGPLDQGHLPALRRQHPPILRGQVPCPLVQTIGAPHMTMSRLRHVVDHGMSRVEVPEGRPDAHGHAKQRPWQAVPAWVVRIQRMRRRPMRPSPDRR